MSPIRAVGAILFAAATGCHGQDALVTGPSAPDRGARQGETYVFACPNQTAYVVRANEREAWVFRPAGSLRLPATPAAGGAYTDGRFELRIEGDRATWIAPGEAPRTCRNDRRRAVWEKAKLDGVDFRAVGNEPPWILEIKRQRRIVLISEYGARRDTFPLPPHLQDRTTGTTRWSTGGLEIEAVARPCHDSMSGEAFETQVTIRWAGRTLRGCGRALH